MDNSDAFTDDGSADSRFRAPGSSAHDAPGRDPHGDDSTSEAAQWGPDPRWWKAALVCAVGTAVWLVLDSSDENRLVAAVLTLVLLAGAAWLLRVRVRLRADRAGMTITGMTRSRSIAWADITAMSTPRRGRFGRRTASLELELYREQSDSSIHPMSATAAQDAADTELVVLGAFELGADPEQVGRVLHRLRARFLD